jgi:hypothetical protein
MKIVFLSLLCLFVTVGCASAQDAAPITAVIDIDNRPVAIPVSDLQSCGRAITNRIESLRSLYQNNFTVTSVVGQCFGRDGQLLAAGRCGVRPNSGQATLLCVPDVRQVQ